MHQQTGTHILKSNASRKTVSRAEVDRWRRFRKSIDKTPDPSTIRKILEKDSSAVEETLKLPTGDVSRIPEDALVINHEKSRNGRPTWQDKGQQKILEESKADNDGGQDNKGGNPFMHYKARAPDGIYPVCLQKELNITIKYLIGVFGDPLAMGRIPV